MDNKKAIFVSVCFFSCLAIFAAIMIQPYVNDCAIVIGSDVYTDQKIIDKGNTVHLILEQNGWDEWTEDEQKMLCNMMMFTAKGQSIPDTYWNELENMDHRAGILTAFAELLEDALGV